MQRGDYVEGQLSEAMNKPPLVADVVETWLKLAEGRPTLCYGVDCAHARALQERFLSAGIPCGYQDAYTDSYDRDVIKRKFHEGEYKVVCNCETLTTGIDWDVRCISLVRPTKSEMLYVQIIGRGLRTAEGKAECLILDHSNTTLELGFVTDIFHDTLDDGKPKDKAEKRDTKKPKECPKCHNLRPAGILVCPVCGHKVKPKMSDLEPEDGELVEVVRKGKKGRLSEEHFHCVRMGERWMPFGQFYGMLKHVAMSRGYKEGWASNKYRDLIGTWPNNYKYAPEVEPSPEVLSWIKAGQIKWAKRRPREDKPFSLEDFQREYREKHSPFDLRD